MLVVAAGELLLPVLTVDEAPELRLDEEDAEDKLELAVEDEAVELRLAVEEDMLLLVPLDPEDVTELKLVEREVLVDKLLLDSGVMAELALERSELCATLKLEDREEATELRLVNIEETLLGRAPVGTALLLVEEAGNVMFELSVEVLKNPEGIKGVRMGAISPPDGEGDDVTAGVVAPLTVEESALLLVAAVGPTSADDRLLRRPDGSRPVAATGEVEDELELDLGVAAEDEPVCAAAR